MLKILKNIFKFFMSRVTIISLLLLFQLGIVLFLAYQLWRIGIYIYIIFNVLSIIASLFILNRSFNPAYKISWIMLVLVIPIAGYIFYLLFGSLRMSKNRKKLIKALDNELINEASKYKDEIKLEDANLEKLATYINNTTGLQVQRNTMSKFLPSGEDFHKELLAELKKQKSLFLWNTSLFVKGICGKV